MATTPFIAYYEHLAKLAQVANKQTFFLAHILYHMEFDQVNKQYYVDISTMKKLQIMAEVSPNMKPENRLNLANQYINKLKKAGFIRSLSRGVWLVNPMCYGKYRSVSKGLRTENAKIYTSAEFTADQLVKTKIEVVSPETGETEVIEVGDENEYFDEQQKVQVG